MRSDLRNLAAVQETYWIQNRVYYGAAIPNAAIDFRPSPCVVLTMVSADAAGWSATAAAPAVTAQTCAIFYGSAAPLPPATVDGAVKCT